MIKIVEVIGSLAHRGGAEVFFGSLCSQFATNREIELSIICLHSNIDDSLTWIKDLPNVNFYCVDKKNGIDFSASRRFRRIIKKIKPDILHMHLACFSTYFFAFGFQKNPWKTFETIHTIPGTTESGMEKKLKTYFIQNKKIILISISKSLAVMAKNEFSNDEGLFVYNGISFPSKMEKDEKKYDFIIVASMIEVKNHRLLFESFKMLLDVLPHTTLLCLGGGVLFEENKLYAQKLGIEKSITFLGERKDTYSYLNQAKIIVLSSKREGNPISILEGMSVGLPVIAPNVGGIPDIIENGKNGLLFELENKEQLFNCMKRLLNDKSLYRSMSIANLNEFKKYSIEKSANEYLAIFQRFVKK